MGAPVGVLGPLSPVIPRSAGDPETGAIGTTALAPLPAGEALVATVVHSTSEVARRWDLVRAVQSGPRMMPRENRGDRGRP